MCEPVYKWIGVIYKSSKRETTHFTIPHILVCFLFILIWLHINMLPEKLEP